MAFFRCFIQLPQLALPKAWRATAVGLLVSSQLLGCGGGSGSAPNLTLPPDIVVETIKSGAYTATVTHPSGGYKALTLIIKSDSANSANGQFFGLQFNSPETLPQQPDIFSGSIAGIGSTTARVTGLSEFSTYENELKVGSATFTPLTQGKLKVNVTQGGSIIEWNNANGVTLDTQNSLLGDWTGNLYFPTGSVKPNLLIRFTAAPTIADPQNLSFTALGFGIDCLTYEGTATPSPSGVNLFNLSMKLPNTTNCDLSKLSQQHISLSGVAFITTSPDPSKKRLQWVATTSDGRGLSFRADR